MLTGRIVTLEERGDAGWGGVIRKLTHRVGEPMIRQAVTQAVRVMSNQFVMGRNITEALERSCEGARRGVRYSFDMLGEAARTRPDADRYFAHYMEAIEHIGEAAHGASPIERPGVSVKLSALHPRYELAQADRLRTELLPRLMELCAAAKAVNIGLCVDSEEAERLEPSLDLLEAVAMAPSLSGWEGLGVAVQAYQKRAWPLIDWLTALAGRSRRRLMVRLVKGAYWDSEIKHAQELGLEGYPVFTRKAATDVSYLACARKLLAAPGAFYPCFATHNAHTVAAVMAFAAPQRSGYEFQKLHGMGDVLYDEVSLVSGRVAPPLRVYAPVGEHEDLLAYLVRRLLENGANSSFINRIFDEQIPVSALAGDPATRLQGLNSLVNPKIPLPRDLFGSERLNSAGLDLSNPVILATLKNELEQAAIETTSAKPLIAGRTISGAARPVLNPADRREIVGDVIAATEQDALAAVQIAAAAQPAWDATPASERAAILERAADLFEADRGKLIALIIREAGKTIAAAVAELREAVDYLRYYATRARAEFSAPALLPGPTGERNTIALRGRGVFLCVSPWNFPLAIFTGQAAAALAAGNTVLAKPAEQTPLIAFEATKLMHKAGVPAAALCLLPGSGSRLGAVLTPHPLLAGVAFTGSAETARLINCQLAAREGPILPLIAETGGQNAMIVDSSALPEQVTRDVLASAFDSAGQRCSALRALFLQEEVADRIIEMISGAMAELRVGDPRLLATDVGPIIDADACKKLTAHARRMDEHALSLFVTPVGPECKHGDFFAPRAYEIPSFDLLESEVFGPVLHVIRFRADALDELADVINDAGYGLTASIHSRIEETIDWLTDRLRVGNIYVNRGQTGAVVGVQPFGGEGLSGTGPKAGGPRYLHRFAVERTLSVDTTASGGNTSLLTAEE
jgi:RHH-type proline utilization regulon transcriptional repressor/proline dehydrogenase/delta 1-pyrroline-5-carboxylate dehydrogenase